MSDLIERLKTENEGGVDTDLALAAADELERLSESLVAYIDENHALLEKVAELTAKMESTEPAAWLGSIIRESGYGVHYDRTREPVARLHKNSKEDKPLYLAPPSTRAAVEAFKRRAIEVLDSYPAVRDIEGLISEVESLPLIEEK